MERTDEIYNLNRHYTVIASSEARRQTIAKTSILSVLTLERLAYYALVTSFYLFLNEGPWHHGESWYSLEALNAVFFLTGISYLSALLGGYISDAYLGRFITIALGFVLYIIGYVLLALISVDKLPHFVCSDENQSFGLKNLIYNNDDDNKAPCKTAVYLSLTILGIGSGTVKSNIAPFGAEQLRSANSHKIRSFFNWFYWCVNIGSLVGIGVIAFIEQDNPGVCTNGFFCGYLIGSVCLLISLIMFLCAYPWYYIASSEGSLLRDIIKIVMEAVKANFKHWRLSRQNLNSSPLHVEPAFLDRAKIRYGGSFHEGAVDDVSALGKLVAVFCALIPYWIVSFQMETSFQSQGLHMRFADFTNNVSSDVRKDLDEEKWEFSVPAAWLTLFNQAFLILAIPILTSFLYPKLDRAGIRLSLFFRIGLGMIFSTIAVMTAGGLESYRTWLWRNDPSSHIDLIIGNATYHAVNISIFWQIPQYVLVGAAEVFANIAGLEFAYTAAPATFQGLIMGLFYSLEGCASFLGIFLLRLVSPYWFNNETDYSNINENHLDFYLYFLGIIQFTTLAAFCMVLYAQRFALRLVGMPSPGDTRLVGNADSTGIFHSDETEEVETETEMERGDNDLRSSSSMNDEEDKRPLIP